MLPQHDLRGPLSWSAVRRRLGAGAGCEGGVWWQRSRSDTAERGATAARAWLPGRLFARRDHRRGAVNGKKHGLQRDASRREGSQDERRQGQENAAKGRRTLLDSPTGGACYTGPDTTLRTGAPQQLDVAARRPQLLPPRRPPSTALAAAASPRHPVPHCSARHFVPRTAVSPLGSAAAPAVMGVSIIDIQRDRTRSPARPGPAACSLR